MSVVALSPDRLSAPAAAEGAPVLRWMIFTGACAFAAVLAWHYNLIRLMVVSDRTYISSIIAVLYIGASLHCLWRTIAISREGDAGRRTADRIAAGEVNFSGVDTLPPGLVADHIRDLALKARMQGTGRLDQTLLLRSLADRLRGSNGFGAFASDTLMKLGLLGTIAGLMSKSGTIGFVGSKVTGSHNGGFKLFKGTFEVVPANLESSKITAEIDTTSIFTDNDGLTNHLKSPEFFDVAKFPTSNFVSTGIEAGVKDPKAKVPDGKMLFAGLKRPAQLADVIAYLKKATQ